MSKDKSENILRKKMEDLTSQNESLSEQVKTLIKTESNFYIFQEKLDLQMNLYRSLNQIGSEFNKAEDPDNVYELIIEYIEYELNFESVIIFKIEDDGAFLPSDVSSNYEDKNIFSQHKILRDTPLYNSIINSTEVMIFHEDNSEINNPFINFSKTLGLKESMGATIKRKDEDVIGFVLLGNTEKGLQFNTRIELDSDIQMALLNLLNQASITLNNINNYQLVQNERSKLEAKVIERTKELEKAYGEIAEQHTLIIQKEKLALFGEITAGASHEISSPLLAINAGVSGLYKLLKTISKHLKDLPGEPLPENLKAKIKNFENKKLKIDHSIESIKTHLKQMKNFIRFQSEKTDFYDINDELNTTLYIVRYSCPANVEIVTDFSNDLKKVYGNPAEINQLLSNVIVNSMESIPSSIDGVITIQTYSDKKDDHIIKVKISDNGVGIDTETKSKLFTDMIESKKRESGIGLGLYLCKEIIKNNHIEFKIESSTDNGSSFEFTFNDHWIKNIKDVS